MGGCASGTVRRFARNATCVLAFPLMQTLIVDATTLQVWDPRGGASHHRRQRDVSHRLPEGSGNRQVALVLAARCPVCQR